MLADYCDMVQYVVLTWPVVFGSYSLWFSDVLDLLRSAGLKTSSGPPFRCWFVLAPSDCYARKSFILADMLRELVRGSGFRVGGQFIHQCEP